MAPEEVDVLETLKKDNLLDMEYGQNRMNSSYTIDNYTNQSGYIFIVGFHNTYPRIRPFQPRPFSARCESFDGYGQL